jgi:hypothetical protein
MESTTAAMSNLRVICPECGEESLTSGADHKGRCVVCLTSELVAPLKAEYLRLWAKRSRYQAAGVNLRPVESQLATVARRLGDKVHARIANPEHAIAILNAHLEEARNIVERGAAKPRILLPRPGDMVMSHA